MQQLFVEYIIELPDDILDRGDVLNIVKGPLRTMTDALEQAGIKYQEKLETIEGRRKRTDAGRKRKPPAAPDPPLLFPHPDEAAE